MLKLRKPRNAYGLLGLPRSATPEKVRARYLHLARSYRKGVPPRELLEDEGFRCLTNAYLLLVGEGRREYDRRLRKGGGRDGIEDLVGALPDAGRVLLEAEVAYGQRRMRDAAELAKEAVKQDNRNAQGYALLGDVLREQGKYRDAYTMYNYAVQFAPNNRRYWQGLEETGALRDGRGVPRRYRGQRATLLNRPFWVWLAVAGALLVIGAGTLYLQRDWGAAGFLNMPTKMVYAGLAAGWLMGLLLAATSVLQPFDDELISYQVSGFGVELMPVGIFIALPAIVFFWVAPVFYAIVAYLDEQVSASILIALLVCGLLSAWFGMLAPGDGRLAAYLMSGNVAFFGFLWGWLFGSIRRRVFEH